MAHKSAETMVGTTSDDGAAAPIEKPYRRHSFVKLTLIAAAFLAITAFGGKLLADKKGAPKGFMAVDVSDAISAQGGGLLESNETTLDLMIAQIEVQVQDMQSQIREKVGKDEFDGVSALADQVKDLMDYVNASKALQVDVADVKNKIATGRYEDSATELAEMVKLKCLSANHFKITAVIEGMERNAHMKKFERAHELVSDLNELQEMCETNSTNSTRTEPDSEDSV